MRAWLLASGAPPLVCGDEGAIAIIEYLNEVALGGCPRTGPKSVCLALGFFETCGGIAKDERISLHPLVANTVKDLERELTLGKVQAVKKAPHFPVAIVLAMEAAVMDEEMPVYKRVFTWYKLVRIWGSLRFDDALHVRPEALTLDEHGLSLVVHSSKT